MRFLAPLLEPRALVAVLALIALALVAWWDERRLTQKERARRERQYAGNRRPGNGWM